MAAENVQLWKLSFTTLSLLFFYFDRTLVATTHQWQRCVFPYHHGHTLLISTQSEVPQIVIWGTAWWPYHNISVRPWPINSRREQLREYLYPAKFKKPCTCKQYLTYSCQAPCWCTTIYTITFLNGCSDQCAYRSWVIDTQLSTYIITW